MNNPASYLCKPPSWIRSAQLMIFLGLLIGTTSCRLPFQESGNSETTPIIPTNAIPTLFIPTPDCGTPTLVIGTTLFQIQSVQTEQNGALTIPADGIGNAYWVNKTNPNYMFGLSSTQDNQSLIISLVRETTATVTWSNCNSTSYTLDALEQNPVNISTLLDQPTEGITIFLSSDPYTASHILRGQLIGEQISTFNTPSGTDIQAEISLLETTASPDGTSVMISASIQNYGQSPFTLSASDMSLTTTDGILLQMLSSEPSLPKEIPAGSTETLYFTFQKPSSTTAIFGILGIEYEVEGY